MRKLPPLNAVRAFEAAARHGSLTKAAEELHVTHGAVSRQVALLEEWAGRPLFKRTPTQLVLTERGRTFQQRLTPLLDQLATAAHALVQDADAELRVKAPPTFTMRWLIPRMSGFQRQFPEVRIRLATATTAPDLQQGDCDVAIHSLAAEHERSDCRRFMGDCYVPICHADLLAASGGDGMRVLRDHPLISYATWPDSWKDWLDGTGVEAPPPERELHFEQMFFALQAAQEGLGCVVVPLALVLDELVQGRLAAPFALRRSRERPWLACMAEARRADPVVEGFVTWLAAEGQGSERSAAEWARGMGWEGPPTGGSSQG